MIILRACYPIENVDGLHLRSGLPRSKLSILHGDCFVEKCERCKLEYVRDFDVGGVSFKPTGRLCEDDKCQGVLRDVVVDWNDALPEIDLDEAEKVCRSADLVIALGTSLRIVPAGRLPLLGTTSSITPSPYLCAFFVQQLF